MTAPVVTGLVEALRNALAAGLPEVVRQDCLAALARYEASLGSSSLREDTQTGSADRWSGLERLAKAATSGEWTYADNAPRSYGSAWVDTPDVRRLAVCDGTRRSDTHGFCLRMDEDENERNAAFIAAANPAAVLDLIAAARQQAAPGRERGE